MMNVQPRSENLGNTVGVRGGGGSSGIKLQHGEKNMDESEEDEDFMALMNENKSRETPETSGAFSGSAGLPGAYQPDQTGDFQMPAASDSWGGNSGHERPSSYESPANEAPPSAPMHQGSFRSLEEEKQHYLYKIQRLQSRFSGRRVGLETPVDELKYEYDRLKRQSELSSSVKFQRRTLMATVSGIEYLNKSFNPLGLHLDGWSEQVMDSLEDFDQTFEQLHDKYQGSSEVSPEWNLLIMLLGSGFMFHLSNSLFKSVLPNVNDVAKNNPDLMSQIASAMRNAMNGNQGAQAPSGSNNSELGAGLAMQAMQQKLRPQAQVIEEDEYTELESEPPAGFEQAAALRKPPPIMGRPKPSQRLEEIMSDDSSISDVSSELSMSDAGDIRRVSPAVTQKRPAKGGKGGASKKGKNTVSIAL